MPSWAHFVYLVVLHLCGCFASLQFFVSLCSYIFVVVSHLFVVVLCVCVCFCLCIFVAVCVLAEPQEAQAEVTVEYEAQTVTVNKGVLNKSFLRRGSNWN